MHVPIIPHPEHGHPKPTHQHPKRQKLSQIHPIADVSAEKHPHAVARQKREIARPDHRRPVLAVERRPSPRAHLHALLVRVQHALHDARRLSRRVIHRVRRERHRERQPSMLARRQRSSPSVRVRPDPRRDALRVRRRIHRAPISISNQALLLVALARRRRARARARVARLVARARVVVARARRRRRRRARRRVAISRPVTRSLVPSRRVEVNLAQKGPIVVARAPHSRAPVARDLASRVTQAR